MKNNEGQGLIWKNNEAQGLICDSMAFTCLLKFGSAAIFFLAIATLRLTADYCRAKKRDKVHLHIEFARDSLPRQFNSATCGVEAQRANPQACQSEDGSFSDGRCHALFVSKTKNSSQPVVTDQAPLQLIMFCVGLES
jgi:hypothetical protein